MGAEINRQIRMIVADIVQRPKNVAGKPTSARKVKIELSFTPRLQYNKQTETEELIGIDLEPKVDGVTPSVVGDITDLRVGRSGVVTFNKAFPSAYDQMPLPFEAEEADAAE